MSKIDDLNTAIDGLGVAVQAVAAEIALLRANGTDPAELDAATARVNLAKDALTAVAAPPA